MRKFILTGAFFIFFILAVLSIRQISNDYEKRQRLSIWACIFILATLLFQAYAMILSTGWIDYNHPPDPVFGLIGYNIGRVIFSLGAIICVIGILQLIFCFNPPGSAPGKLQTSGLYYFSRNPQIIGYILMILSVPVIWTSISTIFWALLLMAFVHAWVRMEEEHLTKAFGDQYASYTQKTPRYLGLPHKRPEA